MAYAAMPNDLKRTLDNEFAKSNLLEWAQPRTFLITYSDADNSARDSSTTPISLALADDHPASTKTDYTPEEWMAFALRDDGKTFIEDNPNMPDVHNIVMAMHFKCKGKGNVKGSPRGNGKQKRKGQGRQSTARRIHGQMLALP